MRVITFLFGLVGVVSALAYLITQTDIYYTIFMFTMPYIGAITALNEWKAGRKVNSILFIIVSVASTLVLGDLIFGYI